MSDFSNADTLDDDYERFRSLPLSHLLSSAVDRCPEQSVLALAYLDMDKLLIDDSKFVDQLFSRNLDKEAPLGLWLSRWENSVSLEKIIGYLTALRAKLEENKFKFHFVLPNPYICVEKARLSSVSLEEFFQKFTNLAPCEAQPIQADETAFQLLKRVMSLGVRTNVVIDVSLLEDPLNVAKGPDFDTDDDLTLNRVCNTAFELKQALTEFSGYYSVQTFSFSEEARQTLFSPFAVPLLRTLCLLRHIFPSSVPLYASPGLLGKNLYLLINELGICSRREGALELASAEALNLPLLSEISRVQQYAI